MSPRHGERASQWGILSHMSQDIDHGAIPQLTLGWRLQMALSQSDMRAQTMANELGVSRATVSRWMHDEGAPPRRAFVAQWALATGVPAKWLETGETPTPGGPDDDPRSSGPTGWYRQLHGLSSVTSAMVLRPIAAA